MQVQVTKWAAFQKWTQPHLREAFAGRRLNAGGTLLSYDNYLAYSANTRCVLMCCTICRMLYWARSLGGWPLTVRSYISKLYVAQHAHRSFIRLCSCDIRLCRDELPLYLFDKQCLGWTQGGSSRNLAGDYQVGHQSGGSPGGIPRRQERPATLPPVFSP